MRKVSRGRVGLMSKIEKPQAIERIDEIIELSDALMVARGDLGVEMPLEAVPGLQKQLIRACRRAGKPVVVATQMLESMISAPVPTRAEVSDVATAVFEGADAVMLSAESASGDYPVEAVSTMASIASKVELDPHYSGIIYAQRTPPEATGADAISLAAHQIAETLKLSAIVCYTSSGTTGLRTARERPQVPILALSPVIQTAPGQYYAVVNGVWFAGSTPSGPWLLADAVPPAIYTIPPSSPMYYVTYVHVYGATPDVVYVGYTPGYYGTYVVPTGTVVYGTGYVYQPWVGSVWIGPPYTYGFGAGIRLVLTGVIIIAVITIAAGRRPAG